MYKLTFEKRSWIIKQIQKGIQISDIAQSQKVSDRTIRKIHNNFKVYGIEGFKDHKTGRPETILNEKSADLILKLRKEHKYGACHIEEILKSKGFSISHRQIEKTLIRNDQVVPNLKKQKSRKWVRYQLPNPNDLWHTDWTYDPFTDKQLSVYIDDRTRLITSFGIFPNANTENSICLLKQGISAFGKPKAVMTDHGPQYFANYPNADQNNCEFRKFLNILGIKHVLARVNRPQTNGKVERFNLTYKTEFINGNFQNLPDFIKFYNEERLHMSLSYKTPKSVWNELRRN
jgi:putative transposase